MARRKRRSGFGGDTGIHRERSKGTIREIRRVNGLIRRNLRSPPDCEEAARLIYILGQQEGAYWIDRFEGGRMGGGHGSASGLGRATTRIVGRFIDRCVVKPKSAAAARKMRAVWR